MTDFGDRLRNDYLLPPTPMAIEDANLIEGLLPRDADPIIDDTLNIIEILEDEFTSQFNQNLKDNRQSPNKRPRTDSDNLIMRRRQPKPTVASYNSMQTKVKKLSCCVDTELLHKEIQVDSLNLAVDTTDSVAIFNTITQGDSTENRTGKQIRVKSIEFNFQKPVSSGYPGNDLPVEIFLCRPYANGTAPVAADFTVDQPGSLYSKDKGWQVAKCIPGTSSQLYKRVNLRNMKVTYSNGTPRDNNIYLVYRNYGPAAATMNGTIRISYYG